MKIRVKNTLIVIILLGLIGISLIIARSYIFHSVRKTIAHKLESLNKKDFHIKYDSIIIDWKKNLIVVDKLIIEKDVYDTTCVYPEFISASQVRVTGFRLLKYVFSKRLSFESVLIKNPHIVIRQRSKLLLDQESKKENEFSLTIDNVRIDSAHIEYTDSTNCKLITDFKSNLSATDLVVDFHSDKPFVVNTKTFAMSNTGVVLPKAFYAFQITKTRVDFAKGNLEFDSVKIEPLFGKLEFGKKKGHDIDRVEGIIPFFKLNGFSMHFPDSLLIKTRYANVQGFVKIFHDKRLNHENKFKPLPVHLVRSLKFGLQIDTLEITKSYIEYEEWAKKADSPGSVYFDDLKGYIYDINNDNSQKDGETIMKATGAFMGQGLVEVTTVMPWKENSNYVTEGTVRNLSMTKLNPMMEPAANMKVESGKLEKLSFKFAYNNTKSNGNLQLIYHDLRLTSFKDEKGQEEKKKDNLKTFLINTFVIRKNMDHSLPEEKRTGTIEFNRDKTRSIFNFWWKSLLSGIKSAYNIDKMELQKKNKVTKQQARKEKREKRKQERKHKT